MSCNGWTNSQTWNVSLWFGDMLQDLAEDMSPEDFTAEYIEEAITEITDQEMNGHTGFVADIVTDFLKNVNWEELADHYKGEDVSAEGLVNE